MYQRWHRNARGEKVPGFWYWQPPTAEGHARPQAMSLRTKSYDEAAAMVGDLMTRRLADDRTGHLEEVAEQVVAAKLKHKKWTPKTAREARASHRRLIAFMGNRKPDHVSRDDLLRWHASMLEEGLSAASAAHHIRQARSVFSSLLEMGITVRNPAAALRLPTVQSSRRDRFCSAEERDRLIDAAADRPHLQLILYCGFHAGMRYGEIVHARPEWIQRSSGGGGSITVQADEAADWVPKGKKARSVPLSRAFAGFLDRFDAPGPYLLRPDKPPGGRHQYRYDAKRAFKNLAAANGLPWVTFHTMRHTFGSLLSIAGVSDLKIRRWMGISSEVFERHYAGLHPEDPDIDRM